MITRVLIRDRQGVGVRGGAMTEAEAGLMHSQEGGRAHEPSDAGEL